MGAGGNLDLVGYVPRSRTLSLASPHLAGYAQGQV